MQPGPAGLWAGTLGTLAQILSPAPYLARALVVSCPLVALANVVEASARDATHHGEG